MDRTVTVDGMEYGVKIDLNVLEKIQNKYGTVNEWERDILGIRFEKDEEGNQKYTKDGEPIIRKVEPSIKAIRMVLPDAINEALEIRHEMTGQQVEHVSEKKVARGLQTSYETVAEILHDAFKECFVSKK